MKKYRSAMEKIKASDELKKETVDMLKMKKFRGAIEKVKASDELKKETVDMLLAAKFRAAATTAIPKKTQRFSWNFARLTASASMAAMLFFCAIFIPIFSVLMLTPPGSDALYPAPGDILPLPETSRRDDIIDEIKKSKTASDTQLENDLSEAEFGADEYKNNKARNNGEMIKTLDGYLYKLSPVGLATVNMTEMKISNQQNYEKFVPAGLFIFENRLIVTGGIYDSYYYTGSKEFGAAVDYSYASYQNTQILIYDITNRANPTLLNDYTISGYLLTAGLNEGKLTFAVNYYFDIDDENSYFPKIGSNEIDSDKIYLYKTNDSQEYYRNYIITASVDLKTAAIDYTAHLGLYGYDTVYVTDDSLYVFTIDFSTVKYIANKQVGVISTKIFKISLSKLQCVAETKIDGVVQNRSYVDETDENLRLVSYVNVYDIEQSYTNVYVLDNDLKKLGEKLNLAVGKRINSVQFIQNEVNIQLKDDGTSLRMDLSDPAALKVSEGIINNPSTAFPLNGGINLDLSLNAFVDNGKTMFTGLGVKLSNNDGIMIVEIEIGDGYVYSEALYNPDMIVTDASANRFAFPVNLWSYANDKCITEQGLAVFEYDLTQEDDANKLVFCGILSDSTTAEYADWNEYYDAYHSYVVYGAQSDGKLYTVSDRFVTCYNATTFELIQRLPIAEFKTADELFQK